VNVQDPTGHAYAGIVSDTSVDHNRSFAQSETQAIGPPERTAKADMRRRLAAQVEQISQGHRTGPLQVHRTSGDLASGQCRPPWPKHLRKVRPLIQWFAEARVDTAAHPAVSLII
jgi:hypothetical protein